MQNIAAADLFNAGMVRAWRVACAAALLGVICLSSARAQAEHVRYCFNEWAPYAFVEDGRSVGISVDVMREASRLAGFAAAFVELPWNRCLESVRDGANDAVLDAADRAEFLQGPTSYAAYSNTIWVRSSNPLRAFAYADLSGRTVGLVSGYDYPPDLLDRLKAAHVAFDFTVDDGANLRKLAFGRVDAVVADRISAAWFASRENLDLRPLTPDHSSDLLYPSFNPVRRDMQAKIDAALGEMLRTGAVLSVFDKYIGD